MKKILITGISRGLGKFLAAFLAEKDCEIYGTVRDINNFTNTENIKYYYLDYFDKHSIQVASNQIIQDAGYIDIIIHNAGIAYLDPVDVMTEEERRSVFEVNFFGPIQLTEQILPSFRKRNDGKLIFISSVVSVDHWPFLGIYSASKAALESVAFEWAVLLQQWNIFVSVIRPNPLPTNMGILRSKNSLKNPYNVEFSNKLEWENIENVCRLVLKIINDRKPRFDYQTGKFSEHSINKLLKKNAYQKLLQNYRLKYSS